MKLFKKIVAITSVIAPLGATALAINPPNKNNGHQSAIKTINGNFNYYSLAKKWQKEVIYQIFPIAYRDSNNDEIGDINGITESIPYLKKLGITTIWINPVFLSDSYHKYDIIDYKSIDSNFGNMNDFKNMINKMHQNNIKVVLDMALNHASTYNKWFRAAINKNDPQHKKFKDFFRMENNRNKPETKNTKKWFNIKDAVSYQKNIDSTRFKNAKIKSGYFYSAFGSPSMVDLNLHNPDVQNAIVDVAKFWIDKGIDGIRLDATRHAYDAAEYSFNNKFNASQLNQDIWTNFAKKIIKYGHQKNKEIYIVGENAFGNWWNLKQYVSSYSQLDFPFYYKFINYIKNMKNNQIKGDILKDFVNNLSNYRHVDYTKVDNYGLTSLYGSYNLKQGNPDYITTTFIANHDNSRIASILGLNSLAKQAGALQLMLPGIPVIYYGQELGLKGGKNGKNDLSQRQPMPWQPKSQLNKNKDKIADYIQKFVLNKENAWLSQNNDNLNVQNVTQDKFINLSTMNMADEDAQKTFALYKKLIAFRKNNLFITNPKSIYDYDDTNNSVTAMKINYNGYDYIILANFTSNNQLSTLHNYKAYANSFYKNQKTTTQNGITSIMSKIFNKKSMFDGTLYKIYGDSNFKLENNQLKVAINAHSIAIFKGIASK